ncbi:hypothetical protein CSB69_0602 [Morganella morganii]|nr:hypothetical protein CSB69_0602 [Morganella morganii]EMP52349.1 hypothetical protein C790_03952 [Morganella morganii SC01]
MYFSANQGDSGMLPVFRAENLIQPLLLIPYLYLHQRSRDEK